MQRFTTVNEAAPLVLLDVDTLTRFMTAAQPADANASDRPGDASPLSHQALCSTLDAPLAEEKRCIN
jgi:hypothetical protein